MPSLSQYIDEKAVNMNRYYLKKVKGNLGLVDGRCLKEEDPDASAES